MTMDTQVSSLQERWHTSFNEGWRVEGFFVAGAKAAGWSVQVATLEQDRRQHIDFILTREGERLSVDVKGMKRLNRLDAIQGRYTCVELHGKHPNNQGWLYGGKADVIAFEQPSEFWLIDRTRLIDFVAMYVSNECVTHSRDAIYKQYNRQGHERITWVVTQDMRNSYLLRDVIRK